MPSKSMQIGLKSHTFIKWMIQTKAGVQK